MATEFTRSIPQIVSENGISAAGIIEAKSSPSTDPKYNTKWWEAFDGNSNTRWIVEDGSTAIVTLTFKSPIIIDKINVKLLNSATFTVYAGESESSLLYQFGWSGNKVYNAEVPKIAAKCVKFIVNSDTNSVYVYDLDLFQAVVPTRTAIEINNNLYTKSTQSMEQISIGTDIDKATLLTKGFNISAINDPIKVGDKTVSLPEYVSSISDKFKIHLLK